MKDKIKIITKAAFGLFFALSMIVSVSAIEGDLPLLDPDTLEQAEEQELGSISITLEDTSELHSKENVVFAITKVADINKGLYHLHEDLQNTNIDLNAIETAKELEAAAISLKNAVNHSDLKEQTDNYGYCRFENLEIGVYLIYPLDTADYEDIAPFLVGIPTFDDVKKEMSYDVNVLPKHAPHPTISVLKVDADDHTKVLRNAEFTLYDADRNALKRIPTNEKGIANFDNVKNGTYYIKETQAPSGYQLSEDEIKVIVNNEYNSDYTYQFTVSNTVLPSIATGDTANFKYCLILSISSLAIIMLAVRRKKAAKS